VSAQRKNSGIAHIKEKVRTGQQTDFSIDDTDVLWFKNRLVVPKVPELRQLILDEAHSTRFSIHPGSNKMYQDLKQRFWWTNIKIEIAKYVARCDTCRRVKVEHLKPAGMLQPLPIPSWKWEDISMDFITSLPKTSRGFDSIWVIVDRLTKSAHFVLVKTDYRASDRGTQFVSQFWKQFQKSLGTKLLYSTAYHPQTGGQTERVNQILEDMLRSCALTYQDQWDECLPLAEFSYNNSYQESIKMALGMKTDGIFPVPSRSVFYIFPSVSVFARSRFRICGSRKWCFPSVSE
jgi:hypothetical protein